MLSLTLLLYNYITKRDVLSIDSKQEIITPLLTYWTCPTFPSVVYFIHYFDPIPTCYCVESCKNFQYWTRDFPAVTFANWTVKIALSKPNLVTSKTCQLYLALSVLTTTISRLETSFYRTSNNPVEPTTSEAEREVTSCLHGLLVVPYRSAILGSW